MGRNISRLDENDMIIGGNMRYRAAKEAGLKELPIDKFTIEDAITEAGLNTYLDDRGNIKLEPQYIRVKYINWYSPTKCYATLLDGREVPVYFDNVSDGQIIIHQEDRS